MNREFLRGLGVTEDIIPQIINQHHDTLRPLKEKADQADDFKQQAENAIAELKQRDTELDSLREKAKDNEELLKELDEVKKQRDERIEENRKEQLNSAIKLAVAKEANDANDILTLLDKDQLELSDDGTVKGLDDAINTLKESKPYLFTQPKPTGVRPPEGSNPTLSKTDILNIKDDVERQNAIRENMHLFK